MICAPNAMCPFSGFVTLDLTVSKSQIICLCSIGLRSLWTLPEQHPLSHCSACSQRKSMMLLHTKSLMMSEGQISFVILSFEPKITQEKAGRMSDERTCDRHLINTVMSCESYETYATRAMSAR